MGDAQGYELLDLRPNPVIIKSLILFENSIYQGSNNFKMKNRKYFLILCALIFIASGCTNSVEDKDSVPSIQQSTRPNIILMVADDHGKDAIGAYGNPVIKTPNLDKLAATGTRFNRAFCTTASCSASRSVILTGLHNHANGHYGHMHTYHHFSAFEEVRSLPVLLEELGYRTGRIGKYHLAPESVFRFQEVFQGSARSPVEMANNVQEFISEESTQPFFLYFCFSDPHRGGGFAEELPHAPDRFGNKKEPDTYPGVAEVKYNMDEVIVPPFLPNTPETKAEVAQYYQSISRLDQGVGQLLDHLAKAGKMDNTFIMYISDNGMAFPGAKTTLYEAGMNLPAIAKMPNQKDARVSEAMISWADLTPTILDVAEGLKQDSIFHGQSFLPALKGEEMNRNEIYASHTFHEVTMYYPMRVVRGDKYKLIVNFASGLEYPFASDLFESKTWQSVLSNNLTTLGEKPVREYLNRPKFELYDITADPYETKNLAEEKQYSEVLNNMITKVKSFQTSTNDPWDYKWTYE